MAKKETKTVIERTYNVPLRKEYRKVPRWQRTKKAVSALRQFLSKHMKSDNVKISKELNQKVWKHGIKNPPHHVKITVTKDSEGVVKADLFGEKKGKKKSSKPVAKKEEVKTEEKKTEVKEEVEKVEAPVEEKKEETKEPEAPKEEKPVEEIKKSE
jgi:large subunit ribosomal protein L31e